MDLVQFAQPIPRHKIRTKAKRKVEKPCPIDAAIAALELCIKAHRLPE